LHREQEDATNLPVDRVLEPELMDQPSQALAYARGDFSEPNQAFCDFLVERFPNLPKACRVVDLGCGPADIVRRLAMMKPEWSFTAIDGSAAMLEQARIVLQDLEVSARVQLVTARLPDLPDAVTLQRYDVVLSNSLLHHLPDPSVLWHCARALGKSGAAILVADLLRPQSPAAAQAIVDSYAAGQPEILRRDFFQSLCAAFRPEEIRAQLEASELGSLHFEQVSDRHGYVFGHVTA
jgi:ubiquinone/menaquinone biosynthesis C-methylase UbiE